MKLIEALEIVREENVAGGQPFRAFLACGFNPLHIRTFINAELRLALPNRRIEVSSGLYGDFWTNLAKIEGANAGVVLLEWADFDPRLGMRGLGSWAPNKFDEILKNVADRSAQFREAVEELSQDVPVTISFPTLPVPPISFSPGWQEGPFELQLLACVSALRAHVGQLRGVRIVNGQRLDRLSPVGNRFDVKSEMASGFPYKLAHASTLAELVSRLLLPPTPKKGLITDLDDTLWSGILGEAGAEGVSWDLERHSHMHGVYQRFLHALSEAGVLIAAASKNEGAVVDEAFSKRELLIPQSAIFPIEANWGPKSNSVKTILKTWNIGSDSMVFIDDSPMELAEVKAAYPEVECILFPKDDPQAIDQLLFRLRDLFGKSELSEEDVIRRDSIRRARVKLDSADDSTTTPEDFLRHAEAELSFDFTKEPMDQRAFELVNKTNQFNLNGRKYTESEWKNYVKKSETILLVAAYKDKYGPLGKIAVLAGRKTNQKLRLDTWVMSCRAFSRRIEYRCLQEIFEHCGIGEIEFDFQATPKNGPLREFFGRILTSAIGPQYRLSGDNFLSRQTETFHRVVEVTNG